MKHKSTILLLIFFGASFLAIGQEENQDYLEFNDRKNVVHGVYLGLTTHYGEIEGKDSYFGSFKVAYVANQQFEVGFVGTFFYSDQNLERGNMYYTEDLIGGYGGLHLEPIFFSKSRVNLSFPVLIGAGGMGYVDDDFDEDTFDEQQFEDEAQAFFIVEPGINALFNVSRFLQLEGGIKYRITGGIDDEPNVGSVKDIDGFSIGIGIKVGIFNMGRNRYKKSIE